MAAGEGEVRERYGEGFAAPATTLLPSKRYRQEDGKVEEKAWSEGAIPWLKASEARASRSQAVSRFVQEHFRCSRYRLRLAYARYEMTHLPYHLISLL